MADSSADVKLKVKRIGVLSLGMYFMILYLIIGFIFSIIYAYVISSLISLFSPAAGAIVGVISGIIAVPVITIGFGVLGFISGVLTAVLYNLISRLTGGVEIKVREIEQQEVQTQTQKQQPA